MAASRRTSASAWDCWACSPVLVGAVGSDFDEYRSWLERHGVDTASVHISEVLHTARFVCTTDDDHNQIASFYTGAMSEARQIELQPVADRVGGLDLVLIGADDPEAMLRHTEECRTRGVRVRRRPLPAARPAGGRRHPHAGRGRRRTSSPTSTRPPSSRPRPAGRPTTILARVGTRITTLGARGVRIERTGEPVIEVGCPEEERKVDPTGVGDAFRAGFLAGLSWELGLERSAQIGCMLATLVIETLGTQEYELRGGHFMDRFAKAYGDDAAAEIRAHLSA